MTLVGKARDSLPVEMLEALDGCHVVTQQWSLEAICRAVVRGRLTALAKLTDQLVLVQEELRHDRSRGHNPLARMLDLGK